jgi:hypothetical protein
MGASAAVKAVPSDAAARRGDEDSTAALRGTLEGGHHRGAALKKATPQRRKAPKPKGQAMGSLQTRTPARGMRRSETQRYRPRSATDWWHNSDRIHLRVESIRKSHALTNTTGGHQHHQPLAPAVRLRLEWVFGIAGLPPHFPL